MGYPKEIKPSVKQIASNVVTLAVPFSMIGGFKLGNKMAIFRYGNEIILWSPIPYGPYIDEAIDLLKRGDEELQVTHLILVNANHNLAADSYLKKYPDIKMIGGEGILGSKVKIHYEFTEKDANKVIKGEEAKAKFQALGDFWSNFDFVYLPSHENRDTVVYEKNLHMLFEGDLLMDCGHPDSEGNYECYSQATGFPHQYNPFTGISWLIGQIKAGSFLGWLIHALFARVWRKEGADGVRVVYLLDFDTIVQCHGNMILENAKDVYAEMYPWLKKEQ